MGGGGGLGPREPVQPPCIAHLLVQGKIPRSTAELTALPMSMVSSRHYVSLVRVRCTVEEQRIRRDHGARVPGAVYWRVEGTSSRSSDLEVCASRRPWQHLRMRERCGHDWRGFVSWQTSNNRRSWHHLLSSHKVSSLASFREGCGTLTCTINPENCQVAG